MSDLDSRLLRYRALDIKVLVVAMRGFRGDFTVYIGSVRGNRHSEEWRKVARYGSKLSKSVAKAIFPGTFREAQKEGLVYRG